MVFHYDMYDNTDQDIPFACALGWVWKMFQSVDYHIFFLKDALVIRVYECTILKHATCIILMF